jgi:hypothetical protein
MEVKDEQEHIQFTTNTTSRMKMVEQVQKEKKAAPEVTNE